jgi:hypothetical protein
LDRREQSPPHCRLPQGRGRLQAAVSAFPSPPLLSIYAVGFASTDDLPEPRMSTIAGDSSHLGPRAEGVTLASAWQAVSGAGFMHDLLEWPPDVFALTNVLLDRSEAFRFALSPPAGMRWPPATAADWSDAVVAVGRDWGAWVEDPQSSPPGVLAEEWSVALERADLPLEALAEGRDWRLCEALLTLHAIADEACAGLGSASAYADRRGAAYRGRARELLARTGSLARFPPRLVRVLPKIRTPPTGRSSFARYACVAGSGLEARWHKVPARHPGTGPQAEFVNFLLVPWPLRVRESDFRPVDAARYASVLADDPGSAVLTLTSFGMVQRSRPGSLAASTVVALWKDPERGFREIALESGAQAVLLTACGSRATRRTRDGRCPVDTGTHLFDVAVQQIRASDAGSRTPPARAGASLPRVLDVDDLTVLTGWAEAVAQTLAHAPERMPALLADARPGAAWRSAFGIADPSPQLDMAIASLSAVIDGATPAGGPPSFDAVLAASRETRADEQPLDEIVRSALRATLEQLRSRQAGA